MVYIIVISLFFFFSCSEDSEFGDPAQTLVEENIGPISDSEDNEEQVVVGKKTIVIANRADEQAERPKRDSAGYLEQGDWQQSRLSGFKNTISRYSDDPLASVTYSTDRVKQSRYCISVYRVTHNNSTEKALYQVMDNDQLLSERVVSHREGEGEKGWYHLGEHSFSTGVATVVLKRAAGAGSGFLRADDMRFRRLKDGFDCWGRVTRVVKKQAIIDNRKDENNPSSKRDTAGYRQQGQWHQSQLTGYKDFISRYSFERDASVTYRAQVKLPEYCLRLYRVTHPNSSQAVLVTILVNEQVTDEIVLDYSLSKQQKGWVTLGTYSFSPDDQVKVVLQRDNPADVTALRADALQFTSKLSRCE